MRCKTPIYILIALFALLAPCGLSDAAPGELTDGVNWNTIGCLDIDANAEKTFTIHVYNIKNDTLHVELSAVCHAHAGISLGTDEFILQPCGEEGDRIDVTATVKSDKYVNHEESSIVLTLTSYKMADGHVESSVIAVPLTVHPTYGGGSSINRLLGVFENPLPGPFDGVIVTGAATLLLWVLISAVASSLVRLSSEHIIGRIARMTSERRLVNSNDFKKTWKYVFGIVIMYGIANTMIVVGMDENYIGRYMEITTIVTVLFVAMTLWHINTTLANVLSFKLSRGDSESSLKPLILLLGRIAIVLMSVVIILSIYGISLGSIVVAFGLGAAGISMGAKTIITQFFCGISNMVTRSFRTGDKIKIGTDATTLIIKDVGVMTTKCKNWSNEEIYYIPNSTLADMRIVNITKDNVFYKVYDYYSISYTSSIDRAREIMAISAYEDDGVVSDGSFSMPEVRFSEVDRNGITLRLAYTVVDHEDYGSISARIRRRIFDRFVEEGIDIPYDQYSVRLVGSEKKAGDEPESGVE